jgi:hypothetical protein
VLVVGSEGERRGVVIVIRDMPKMMMPGAYAR